LTHPTGKARTITVLSLELPKFNFIIEPVDTPVD
jgi:hypothetical protein